MIINLSKEDLSKKLEEKIVKIKKLNDSYLKIIKYKRWVIPDEGIERIKDLNKEIQLLNKVYVGSKISDKILSSLRVFGAFTYKYIENKECIFVDYDNPNSAFLCLKHIQSICKIKVGRTPSFPVTLCDDLKNPDKSYIFVTNLDQRVDEILLENIFPCVEDVLLSYNGTFKHSGYGYIRFNDTEIIPKIVKYYSNIHLYGKRIYFTPLVAKMTIPKFSIPYIPEDIYKMSRRLYENIAMVGKILVLKNLIDVVDYDDDFTSEICAELEKYGSIVKIDFLKNDEVEVVCEYSKNNECKQAYRGINGRFFGGRRILAEICNSLL